MSIEKGLVLVTKSEVSKVQENVIIGLSFDEVVSSSKKSDLSKFASIKVQIVDGCILKVLMVLKDKSQFLLDQKYKTGFSGTINYTYVTLDSKGSKKMACKVTTGLDNTDGLNTKVTSSDLNSIRKLVKEQTKFVIGKYDLKF